ncbi:MAG TPA: hypothetical protein VL053_03160 [Arachidicoccus sp.]|nr:hypothetical protein [Arachidicoccus sp.]
MRRILTSLLLVIFFCQASAQSTRWQLMTDGSIRWQVKAEDPKEQIHTDHLEMSGKFISAIVTYGVNADHQLQLSRKLIFPMLRTFPNNTRGNLEAIFNHRMLETATENGQPLELFPADFSFKGILDITSRTKAGLEIKSSIFPSVDKAAYVETYRLKNNSSVTIEFKLPELDSIRTTPAEKGVYGAYIIRRTYYPEKAKNYTLAPGAKADFSMVISARKASQDPYYYAADFEWEKRQRLLRELHGNLQLQTPNDTINKMFDFAKIRAAESIFDTKQGLMHGPGGGAYYAAIWANDQAEYVSPFFPFLGYEEGNASALNCYRLFARYMNPEFKPLPSSIIAEGTDVWQGAGDRGDQAMIAYGATRFAMAYADKEAARRLWPLITWCLEYLDRQKTPEGVIASTSDELEGRFPTGKVNLSTNSLAYAAYTDAAKLAVLLGHTDSSTVYARKAAQLKLNIDRYFGGNVQGFNTYRYYKGNTTLRSWICLPLVVGLFKRKAATIQALLSPLLWSKDGILTASGSKTFWDRSTLYAFRGLFYAGATDTCYKYFSYYSRMRLLGEHVPYAVEAWPEGDQRQLSAESGLYCRAVTEGLFGIQPTGFNSFTVQPHLPTGWPEMSLLHIKAFGHDFNLRVKKEGNHERIIIEENGRQLLSRSWDGKKPLEINLTEHP